MSDTAFTELDELVAVKFHFPDWFGDSKRSYLRFDSHGSRISGNEDYDVLFLKFPYSEDCWVEGGWVVWEFKFDANIFAKVDHFQVQLDKWLSEYAKKIEANSLNGENDD